MPGTSSVILILGAGPNIGREIARTFASRGYKVAIAARSLDEADSTDSQLNITCDFANSDDVVNAFNKVNEVFGIPSVVVYNGKRWSIRNAFEFFTEYPQSARRRSHHRRTRSPFHWPASIEIQPSMLLVHLSRRNKLSSVLHNFLLLLRGLSSTLETS